MTNSSIPLFEKSNASDLIDFKGKVTWVQVDNLNRFGKWSLYFYPDDKDLERIRELQLKNTIKKDDNGWFLQVSRPPEIEFSKGVKTPCAPVKVRDANKNPIPPLIGDGSEVVLTCEVYTYRIPNSERRGKAMRLFGITVHNLVPKTVLTEEREQTESVW